MAQENVPLALSGLSGDFLPREIVGPIFDEAQDQSVVLRLGQQMPVGFGDTAIPTVTQRPEVGVVGIGGGGEPPSGEAGQKPVSSYAYGVETIRPIKLSTIVVVSEEFQRANPGGFYSQITGDLASALGRGIDMAVLYGKAANDGATIPGVKYLAQTENTVALGTSAADEGGMAGDIASLGSTIGSTGPGYDMTSIAADPRFKFTAFRATDMFGNSVFQGGQAPNLTSQVDSIMGLPVVYGKSVSGRVGTNEDTGVQAFAGDWQGQLRYGYALDMTVKTSTESTIVDNDGRQLNLWQNNMMGLLVEAVFGWAIGDVNAFGTLTAGSSSGGGGSVESNVSETV